MKAVSDIQELIRFIGVSSPKFSSADSMVVEIKTWDGDNNRIVRGSNYEGPKSPEVTSVITNRIDSNLLWSYVRTLLETGKSFIVKMSPCRDEWTISSD